MTPLTHSERVGPEAPRTGAVARRLGCWLRARLSHVGWALFALGTVGIAVGLNSMRPEAPASALTLTQAVYSAGGRSEAVTLPHAARPDLYNQPQRVTYTLEVDGHAIADLPRLSIFVPLVNRPFEISVNGERIAENAPRMFWTGPLSSTSELLRIPRPLLQPGRNRIVITVLNGPYMLPTYMSAVYLGPEAALGPAFSAREFMADKLILMSFGAHVMLTIGMALAWYMRRHDSMFVWLLALTLAGAVTSCASYFGFYPGFAPLLPFYVLFVPLAAALQYAATLALVGLAVPRGLLAGGIAAGALCLALAAIGTGPAHLLSALLGMGSLTLSVIASACILVRAAFWKKSTDARLLLGPVALFAWFMLHDAYITATLPAHPYELLLPYGRPLFIAGITILMMRRMGMSLAKMDSANEMLNRTLAAREAELVELYAQERTRTARLVRGQERQRLTKDLHDGLSGHLASIIAMSERAGEEVKPIEAAAREALDDLRLVLYSLDLGDSELPVALANFRERLRPQLQRLGIHFDWSIADMPEITGVTPGNALSVLRILQEAITNAIKHGPARRIAIRGTAAGEGGALITVENDGRPFVASAGGYGLVNMRRRAEHLNGSLTVQAAADGTRMALRLPSNLPAYDE